MKGPQAWHRELSLSPVPVQLVFSWIQEGRTGPVERLAYSMDNGHLMKKAIHSLLHRLGYQLNQYPFHSPPYLRHTARRLEHLVSLGIPVRNTTVLEVGAGAGDFSHYYLDRGCSVTISDARKSNLRFLRRRYPGNEILFLNLENPIPPANSPFDIVHCYGVLYHLGAPAVALEFLSGQCRSLLFLETRVSFGAEETTNVLPENPRIPSLSYSGTGCRPTRSWVFGELKKHFEYVYVPRTQPCHEDFPLEWENRRPDSGPTRAVFVASRNALENPVLSTELLNRQERHP